MKIPTLKQMKNYLQGNYHYFLDKNGRYPEYLREQIRYRLSFCIEDCQKQGACVYCGCPPEKKAYNKQSCNGGDRFPDLMNEEEWNKYKKEHNITIDD